MAQVLFPEIMHEQASNFGKFVCRVTNSYLHTKPFRTWARIASDQYLADLGNEPSDWFGTIYRFVSRDEGNITVQGFLTRKEALFGEFGRPNHDPLVTFESVDEEIVRVDFRDLTDRDKEYLIELLPLMGLSIIA